MNFRNIGKYIPRLYYILFNKRCNMKIVITIIENNEIIIQISKKTNS